MLSYVSRHYNCYVCDTQLEKTFQQFILQSPVLRQHVTLQMVTSILEEHTASFFRVYIIVNWQWVRENGTWYRARNIETGAVSEPIRTGGPNMAHFICGEGQICTNILASLGASVFNCLLTVWAYTPCTAWYLHATLHHENLTSLTCDSSAVF
jgi:hypothetical protein